MVRLTPEEYMESLHEPRRQVYLNGKLVEDIVRNPITGSVVNAMARVYEMEMDSKYRGVLTATSHITGSNISRNVHVNCSTNDLAMRVNMALTLAQELGTCNYSCPGCDLITALASVTFQIDKDLGTDYHSRFTRFLKSIQEMDYRCSGALTDARGDRSKRPLQLDDLSLYLRVVEEKSNGIVVEGVRLHQSGPYANHFHIVVPNVALRKGEESYAVAFAVPAGEKGVKYVSQYNMYTAERLYAESLNDVANSRYGIRETSMIVFDNVFIPWDRVFLYREIDYVRPLIYRFAACHRMICGGACKVGFADLIIGASQLMAEYLGVSGAPHIVEDLTRMIIVRETTYACALAAAYCGVETPKGSGIYVPNEVFGNVAKLQIGEGFYELIKCAGDIAGGLITTAPSLKDLRNPEVGRYVERYLKARVDAKTRIKLAKFLQLWLLHGPMTWHGAGPVQAQKIAIKKAVDIEYRKKLVEKLLAY